MTTASGISLKQYEDQLNGLRKENFHLKLRIYFLEEKLGSGSPPAVQVNQNNVRTQCTVENTVNNYFVFLDFRNLCCLIGNGIPS